MLANWIFLFILLMPLEFRLTICPQVFFSCSYLTFKTSWTYQVQGRKWKFWYFVLLQQIVWAGAEIRCTAWRARVVVSSRDVAVVSSFDWRHSRPSSRPLLESSLNLWLNHGSTVRSSFRRAVFAEEWLYRVRF